MEERVFLNRIGNDVSADTDEWSEESLDVVVKSVELPDGEEASVDHEGVFDVDAREGLAIDSARQANRRGGGRSRLRGKIGRIDGKECDR